MSFIKIPTKGMRDMMPDEMALREYVLNVMKDTYENFGFELIQTPCVEHIENLTSKQGGDNEKLIFKILKRGEKLDLEHTTNMDEMVDSGLRYDLTVPLTRFYANNMNELQSPFRSFQIGNVYRADRPQRGRYREFMQCDLDIFGEKTNLGEIELITAITSFLKKLDFKGFTIKINDRRILNALSLSAGFNESDLESVLISLDKLDKIGFEGVKEELTFHGYDENCVSHFLSYFKQDLSLEEFCKQFIIEDNIVQNLKEIMDVSTSISEAKVVFDPTLVRGMGYYTGPIFEIGVDDLNSSIGGGGRYDNMVANYTSMSVPAVGFSIGFERLVLLLSERGFKVPSKKHRLAFIIAEKNLETFKKAQELRLNGDVVKIVMRSKNFKHQKETLEAKGYEIVEM